jgi:hypothetical protein
MQLGRGRLGRLGDTTPTSPDYAGQFVSGAEQWITPSTAFATVQGAFTSPSTAFGSADLGTTIGVLAVPALLLFLLMGKKR